MEGALSRHEIWRYMHITAGFVGLGVFWVPVFAKKGAPVHVGADRASPCAPMRLGRPRSSPRHRRSLV
jgi:hypothetical protein